MEPFFVIHYLYLYAYKEEDNSFSKSSNQLFVVNDTFHLYLLVKVFSLNSMIREQHFSHFFRGGGGEGVNNEIY